MMMERKELAAALEGVWTALVTPFDERGQVDVAALQRLVGAQLTAGVQGLVACGTTAETPTLTMSERELVVRTVREVAGDAVPVVVGSGSNDTRASIEATQAAKEWGATAALVVCPYYNKPGQDGLKAHFRAVAEAGGLPVVAYNVPGRTVSDLSARSTAELVESGHIVALKDATGDMNRATEILALVGDRVDFSLLSGDDFTILPFVALGGRGVVSVVSNIAPRATGDLVRHAQAGAWAQARPLHHRIVALTRVLFQAANPTPVKAALSLAGWCRPDMRLPLLPADDALTDDLRAALQAFDAGREGGLEGFMA